MRHTMREHPSWSGKQKVLHPENQHNSQHPSLNKEVQLQLNLKVGKIQLKPEKSGSTANNWTWKSVEDNWSLRSPEVQLQLNLTAWASWWILPMAKNRQRCKKMLQGGRKWRKKGQEEGSGNLSTDSVNSGSGPNYQIHILLGWPLGEGNI
jgi:hypothetical protein